MRIVIVGAGMAGLACATALGGSGNEIVLLDKGRGPGGRMSSRRNATPVGEAQFDHGAQYFTARDAHFCQQVEHWAATGVVAPWPPAGPEAWVGVPAMNAPLRDMAAAQVVIWSAQVTQIETLQTAWCLHVRRAATAAASAGPAAGAPAAASVTMTRAASMATLAALTTDNLDHAHDMRLEADLVLVAIPAEQAAVLLDSVAPDFAARARTVQSQPNWTLMLAFAEALAVQQHCWRGADRIAWAARNSAKPQRSGPESWVVQASASWSQAHLDADPAWVSRTLQSALADLLGVTLPSPAFAATHRWRYALPLAINAGALFDRTRGLGVCGDWLIGGRVEAAWQSGTALAALVAATGG